MFKNSLALVLVVLIGILAAAGALVIGNYADAAFKADSEVSISLPPSRNIQPVVSLPVVPVQVSDDAVVTAQPVVTPEPAPVKPQLVEQPQTLVHVENKPAPLEAKTLVKVEKLEPATNTFRPITYAPPKKYYSSGSSSSRNFCVCPPRRGRR